MRPLIFAFGIIIMAMSIVILLGCYGITPIWKTGPFTIWSGIKSFVGLAFGSWFIGLTIWPYKNDINDANR